MGDIVLFGGGPITDVALVYLEKFSDHRVVGFTVDEEYRRGDTLHGRPLVSWPQLEERFPPDEVQLLGPISYRRLNELRKDRYLEGKARGYEFASFIHPDCDILTDEIGENCFILEHNVIQPFARVGNNVVMWSTNHIGHHVTVGDHCFFTSYSGVAGATTIGERCFIGGRVAVGDNLTVGDGCLLSIGAIVATSVPPNSIVFGPRATIKPADPAALQALL